MAKQNLGRIKGTTFKPQVNKGILSFTNDNNEENPTPVRVQGVTFTPHISDKVLSFTNDGELENPTSVNLNTIDKNTEQVFYDWFGTQQEYDGMILRDTETRYNIFDDATGNTNMKFFRAKYPTKYYDERIVRVLQADGKKLASWDKVGDMNILRNGDKPLDDYIVAQGDWGTIYSDGAVEVAQLAPTTADDYQTALACLSEIQENNLMPLTGEFKQFDFNSLQDHTELINDINNANVKEIDSTSYPIAIQNQDSTISFIEKPILKAGTIPTPIKFGCMVTKNSDIYIGNSYENYGDNVGKFGGLTPKLVSNSNGIAKYSLSGTITDRWGNMIRLAETENSSSDKNTTFKEHFVCKIRMTYKNAFIEQWDIGGVHSPSTTIKHTRTPLNDGWALIDYANSFSPTDSNAVRAIAMTSQSILSEGTVVNEGDLFVEIDTNSLLYTRGEQEMPYIPKGIIVPECKLAMKFENKQPLDYSYILKGRDMVHIKAQNENFSIVFGEKYLYPSLVPDRTQIVADNATKPFGNINVLFSNSYKYAKSDSNEITQYLFHHTQGVNNAMINFTVPTLVDIFNHHKILQSILIYKGDLSQSELEQENAKFLKINSRYNNE